MRQTHTFVVLDLSPAAFREISDQLKAADYGHCFLHSDGRDVIDMQGIAVAKEESKVQSPRSKSKLPAGWVRGPMSPKAKAKPRRPGDLRSGGKQ